MANESNVVPDTVLPVVLSGQLQQVIETGFPHDVLVGGVPFRLKPSEENPLLNQLLDAFKDQVDTSREAGENTLGIWWLRSQSTYHAGQGLKYLDGSPDVVRDRFFESRYVYPFTAGEATVAGELTTTDEDANHCVQVTWGGLPKLVMTSTDTNEVTAVTLPGVIDPVVITLGATGIPADITTDGSSVWVAIADAIYRIDSTGTAVKTHTIPFLGPVVIGFAKQRLIVCNGPEIHELDPNPAVPPVVVGAPHFVNPSPDYIYTCVADGPNAIYLTGYTGTLSNVSSLSVTESGGTIVLGPPTAQLRLPPGELATAMYFYTGSLFALATTNGCRIGSFTPYGQPQIGPLTIHDVACHSVTGSGSLIWVGAEDSVWWIDLSTPLDEGGAYSHALFADELDGNLLDVTVLPGVHDQMFATTSTGMLIAQPEWIPNTEATLTTSWVRFGTTEMKRLYYVGVEGDFPAIDDVPFVMSILVETSQGQSKTFNITGDAPYFEFSTQELDPAQSFRLVFTFHSDGLDDHGVLLRSWQLKALPVPPRYPEVVLPLMVADFELPHTGQRLGYLGFAADRLNAVFAHGRRSDALNIVMEPWNLSFRGVISRMQFEQTSPPTATNGVAGILNVVLRSV